MLLSQRIFPKLLVIILISLCAQSEICAQSIIFNHLTVEDGLSNNDVNTVIQDQTGFIWFGTDDGLNRFDGYNFKVFRHDPSDSNSLSDNSIWSLMEDSKGNIWVGTKGGVLNKFDPATEKYTHWILESKITKENSIKSLYEDSKGNIWVGSYRSGLYRLNTLNNKIDNWQAESGNPNSLSHNYVQSIIEDNEDNLLIGTYIGLSKFNPQNEKNGFQRFHNDPDNVKSLSSDLIWALSKSTVDPSIIWVGTSHNLSKFISADLVFERIGIPNPSNLQYGSGCGYVLEEFIENESIIWTDSYSGLLRINLSTNETTRFLYDENYSKSIISNQINKIIKDRSGVIWIATENGISYITPKSTSFNNLSFGKNKYNLSSHLQKKNITAISQAEEDRIWIGTTDGLYSIENLNDKSQLKEYSKFTGSHIWSIATAEKDEVWIGTFGKGLKQFNYKEDRITSWDIDHHKTRTQSLYYNKTLLVDSKKNIWVGYWGVGVALINSKTAKFDVWLNEPGNPRSLSNNDVWVIKEDKLGRIWLGTSSGGLNLYEDKEGGIFHRWIQKAGEHNSLNSNTINSICESKSGEYSQAKNKIVLWIGTSNGLNRFLIKNRNNDQNPYSFDVEIDSYTLKDGLSDNSVNSIIEDDDGNLWLGTGSGISFFDVTKKQFINFTSADGLNGMVMNQESSLQFADGVMLFGSNKGLNVFEPKKIKLSSYKPSIVITDFQIFNTSVKIGDNSPLKESITITKEIVLPYTEDVFSFEFAALDYNSPTSIQYAYQLEGFDMDWIPSGKRRFVTYTNLDPGKYTFKVKSTNADGVWNDEYTSIRIVVNHPWWRTLWAYGSYILMIGLGLFAIRRFELNRTMLRNKLKMRQIESEQSIQLEEMKSRFFANLSHEFRTPLMLIKGPLEQLKVEKSNDKYLEKINLIERNSDRLKELIDQLLELSQLENASIPIRANKENLVSTLKGLVSSFESLAHEKNISLTFKSDSESQLSWFDKDKFEKIINNLLSNALKFTPDGGSVLVTIQNKLENQRQLTEIKISDTGISIPKDKLDKIFDRFFQVDDSTQRSYGGSGIGLALVKEFVDLHKWEISVNSELGKGTEFIINIPIGDDYLHVDERMKSEVPINMGREESKEIGAEELLQQITDNSEQSNLINAGSKPSILIVDDSADVREYLISLLENSCQVFEAANGIEGLNSAIEISPDLIISDVMMPSMDGFEFCEKIKSDWHTSDIPVILLTAKASLESKLEGLEIGADDYLTKPFESRELFIRIKNLLEQRKRLKEKYSNDLTLITNPKNLSSADEMFIKKASQIVESNLDKTNFNTELLAKELLVSRAKLYRKFVAIIGLAPGEFIRTIKLQKAAEMLTQKQLSVTQVAYEIGFSSPAQFTRAFTKQFNCLPSEYS